MQIQSAAPWNSPTVLENGPGVTAGFDFNQTLHPKRYLLVTCPSKNVEILLQSLERTYREPVDQLFPVIPADLPTQRKP